MSVIMRKSTCFDCTWKNSCQRLARINTDNKRNDLRHVNDVFEVIIFSCSLKNYDRSYRIEDKDRKKLYYCTECKAMHHEGSRIGMSHKAKMEADRQERMKELDKIRNN